MIEVEELRYAYPGSSSDTLRGLSFRVSAGEIFGFLGPSGAGKSTTQSVLIGVRRGYRGRAMVGGRDAAAADSGYRMGLGIAFETPAFYLKLSGLENLSFFRGLYPGGGRAALPELVALMERLGLGDARDKPVGAYSKGMRTRLNLARALAHRAPILFLDEPTSGLDPASARDARELVRERAAEGAAVFLTTHDMATADALCDRVAFLVDGSIAACDAPAALKRRYGKAAVETVVEENGELCRREFPLSGLSGQPDFLASLEKPGLRSVRTLDATLDGIFISLTGRELS